MNMPKIQTFVSSAIEEEINNIVLEKRTEGADRFEANLSNTTSMLVELGLRVYKIQRNRQEGGFSQVEFNKVMLENMIKTSLISQKLLRISSRNAEIYGVDDFEISRMSSQIKMGVDTIMEQFFPLTSEDE
ncbi:conjugal transfer protein TraM [Rahnella sp. AA]|nr:conjugal transfer protein TraM [Rahnella sp. AA]